MTEAPYYRELTRAAGNARFAAGPATAGPWAAGLQHGGPPNALAVAEADRAVREATGRDDLVALRLAADFVGPVPVGGIDVRTRVVRAARAAALAEVTIAAGGRDCLHVRVWFVRDADTTAVAATPSGDPGPVPDAAGYGDLDFPYSRSLDWRWTRGTFRTPGPGTVWTRARTPLLDGYSWTALARVALVADSASGIGAELDWNVWSFVNVDLDVHLARPLVGDWVLVDAATQLGPQGSALARSTLSDRDGVLGSGLQTLVLAPLPAAGTAAAGPTDPAGAS